MKKFTLKRQRQSDYATYGKLFDDTGKMIAVTLELPWVDVDQNGKRDFKKSRFVAGTYTVVIRKSKDNGGDGKRPYDVPELVGVPDCDAAQIHRGNLPRDIEGCIAIGRTYTDLPDPDLKDKFMPGISGSKETFDKFMKDLGLPEDIPDRTEIFTLEVIDSFAS